MSSDLSDSHSLRVRLRQSTNVLHRRVEKHFALDRRVWTTGAYRALLSRLLGLYLPLEHRLAGIPWKDSGLVIRERCKASWLESDLTHFGMDSCAIALLDRCRDLPEIDTLEDGIGALYVLEGATLGGQIIIKALQPTLGISAQSGGQFFSSYGALVGLRWREYLVALERLGASARARDAIESSAISTFLSFDRWFAETTNKEFETAGQNDV